MYKVADGLKQEILEAATNLGIDPLPSAVQQMIEAVYEYEHGSADVIDIFNPDDIEWLEQNLVKELPRELLLRMVGAVVQDMALTILSQS